MKRVATLLCVLLPCTLMGLIILIQYYFDKPGFERLKKQEKIRYSLIDEGIHLLPSPLALKILSAGFDAVISEFLMIQSFNYSYQYSFAGRDEGYMNRLYSGVTTLDPYYFSAYRHAGYFLYGPFKMKTYAVNFFRKGIIELSKPDITLNKRWEPHIYVSEVLRSDSKRYLEVVWQEYEPLERALKLMAELAIHYFAYMKENKKAAEIYRYAQRIFPKYKQDLWESEISLRTEEGQYSMVTNLWENYIEDNKDDPRKVELGRYRIKSYTSLFLIDQYEKRLKELKVKTNMYPSVLVSYLPPEKCLDAFGDIFIYVPDKGKLYSRTLLEADIQAKYNEIAGCIKKIYKEKGEYPRDLKECTIDSIIGTTLPYDIEYGYDPETGDIRLPQGFGDDIPFLLLKLVSAEYHYAAKKGEFLKKDDVWQLLDAIDDVDFKDRIEIIRDTLRGYHFSFLPGHEPFAFLALARDGAAYIASGSGKVYYKDLVKDITQWPSYISEWEVVAR